ncbi:MAG TPA: FxLYD domain-containing protein [Thermoanaerobaculia bacterium]|nr:FxLYD domain-containing protein [Thermoanaerobaculia bacterium]
MRRVLSLLVLGLIGLLSGPLAADQVVLRDGRTLDTKKPPVIKGRQAVLTLADGKLVSIPAAEIDLEKTAALAKKAAEAPKAAPAETPRAPSLVDAARATQNARKAAVVLTDQDVAGGYLEVSSGSAEKGEGEVSIGPTTTKKSDAGYVIEGSVLNSGKAPVLGVSVTVEAVGADGKSIATTYAALAKDVLDPGEKASFRAQIDTDKTVERFGYVPRWKVIAPPAKEGDQGEGSKGKKEPGETPGEEAPPPPPAPAKEEAPPQRPPDMAAPPANAPVGAPSQPGGSYLPPPSSNQPKPPGGRG